MIIALVAEIGLCRLDCFLCAVTSTAGTATYIPGASLSDKLRLAASKGQTDRLKALVSLGASFDPDRVSHVDDLAKYVHISGHLRIMHFLTFEIC